MGWQGRAVAILMPSRLTCLLVYVVHCPIQVRGNKPSCLLAQQNRGKLFTVYKPNIGRQSQLESLDSLSRRFRRVGPRGTFCILNAPVSSSPQAALATRWGMSSPGSFAPQFPPTG